MNSVGGDSRSSLELDRERVTCLLLINTQLMKKSINLYQNVISNPRALQELPPQAKQQVLESYQNCTRRIHCNLTVLSHIHEKYHTDAATQAASQNKSTFPVMMTASSDMPELNQLYTKLQELYPEAYQYLKVKIEQMRKQQQQQQQQQGTAHNSPALQKPPVQSVPPTQNQRINHMANKEPGQFEFSSSQNQNPQNFYNMNQQKQQLLQQQQQRQLQQQQSQNHIQTQNLNQNQIQNTQNQNFNQNQNQLPISQAGSAISPQQILQQMNGDNPSSYMANDASSGGMMDFFNT